MSHVADGLFVLPSSGYQGTIGLLPIVTVLSSPVQDPSFRSGQVIGFVLAEVLA